MISFSLSGTFPLHGTQKQIFQKILNGKIEYNSTEWDHISTNGKVGLDFIFGNKNLVCISIEFCGKSFESQCS
jgi:hypothetical protein